MQSYFKRFQNFIETNSSQNNLAIIFNEFHFLLIENDINILQDIIDLIGKAKILVIDECNVFKKYYLIICLDKTLLVVQSKQFNLLESSILNGKEEIIFLKSSIKNYFIKELNMSYISIINNDFQNEIQDFAQYFYTNKQIFFWDLICNCIFAYMVKKSHMNSYFDRIKNSKELFQSNSNLIQLYADQLIVLKSLNPSNVNLVYCIENQKLYATKEFNENKFYEREKSNYIKIRHPFLLQYFGLAINKIFETEKMIIEYIEGPSLDCTSQAPFIINDENVKIKIIFQILIVFEFLHYKKCIYRDLKPNNIMLDKNKNVILIDLESMIAENDSQETKMFNELYSAPEIYESEHYSFSADIYSIGKIIYFLIIGKDPDVNKKEYSNFPIKYIKLQEMCNQCIQLNPKKRPTIDQLVFDFYNNFYQKTNDNIPNFEILKLIKRKDINKYFKYIVLFSEINHPTTIRKMALLYIKNKYLTVDINISIYYLKMPENQNDPKCLYYLGNTYFTIINNEKIALPYLEKSASLQNSNAQYDLGVIYSNENSPYFDLNKSIKYFTLASDKNHLLATYSLGIIYLTRDIKKAIYYLTKSANENHMYSQFNLGSIYYHGIGFVSPDINKAIYYLKGAADQNYYQAQYMLGCIFYEGKFVQRNYTKAIYYFSLSANNNYSYAQNNLGVIYFKGEGVSKDIKKALYYFNLSANQNHIDAQFSLGIIYLNGEKVPKDIQKAIYYLMLAANWNHPDAQYILGINYLNGENVPKDIQKAIYYLKLAANQNIIDAIYILANTYYSQREFNEAIHYYKIASDYGHSYSQFELGNLYLNEMHNYKYAIHYLTLSANQNNPKAQGLLGYMISNGFIGTTDIKAANHYFKLSAKQNNVESQINLGLYYIEKGKDKVEKGINYLEQAAKQNHPYAQYKLGEIYYKNKYIKMDVEKSIYYLTLASKNNFKIANNLLGIIFIEGISICRDIEKAIYYWSKSAEMDDEYAQFNLFILYYMNEFKKQDINKALEYLTKLAKKSFPLALNCLGILYLEGLHMKRDINKSIFYLSEAAKYQLSISQYNLGKIYIEGIEVKQNIKKGIEFLIAATKQNYLDAMCYLGIILYDGKYIKQNIPKAIELLKSAASKYHIFAALNLGLHYQSINDFQNAIKFYNIGSSFKDQYAKNNLGVIYVIQNKIMNAKIYFEEAVNQKKYCVSMFNLANVLLDLNEKENYNTIIKLLLDSSAYNFIPSLILLCFLLTRNCSKVNERIIQNKLKELDSAIVKKYPKLASKLFYYCITRHNMLNKIRKLYYLITKDGILSTEEFNIINNKKRFGSVIKKVDITPDFYDGFKEN